LRVGKFHRGLWTHGKYILGYFTKTTSMTTKLIVISNCYDKVKPCIIKTMYVATEIQPIGNLNKLIIKGWKMISPKHMCLFYATQNKTITNK